ncbi:MAG: hypothetical protein ACRCZS_01630 [Chroococcidiopsis sp.]
MLRKLQTTVGVLTLLVALGLSISQVNACTGNSRGRCYAPSYSVPGLLGLFILGGVLVERDLTK